MQPIVYNKLSHSSLAVPDRTRKARDGFWIMSRLKICGIQKSAYLAGSSQACLNGNAFTTCKPQQSLTGFIQLLLEKMSARVGNTNLLGKPVLADDWYGHSDIAHTLVHRRRNMFTSLILSSWSAWEMRLRSSWFFCYGRRVTLLMY